MRTRLWIPALLCTFALGISCALAGSDQETRNTSVYDRVGKDFIAGAQGDESALKHALKNCEDILDKEPGNAAAMAWQGAGWVCLSGFEFRRGSARTGGDLWNRGFARMDQAAALAPADPDVLIVRGMTLVQCGLHSQKSKSANEYIDKGVTDLLTALRKEGSGFKSWPADARGQILVTAADGLNRLGRTKEARIYYQKVFDELPGTSYAQTAAEQLAR